MLTEYNNQTSDHIVRRKLTRDKLVRGNFGNRGKFVLTDERFRCMVSTENPPEWAITLGVVKYERPPTLSERGSSVVRDEHTFNLIVKEH